MTHLSQAELAEVGDASMNTLDVIGQAAANAVRRMSERLPGGDLAITVSDRCPKLGELAALCSREGYGFNPDGDVDPDRLVMWWLHDHRSA